MKQLKVRQVCLFFIAFMPLTKLFTMPSVAATFAREDCWISVGINLFLDFLTVCALVFWYKKSDETVFSLLDKRFGKKASKVILFLYALFFLFKAVIPYNEQKDYVEQTLYITLPSLLDFMPIFIVTFYICLKHLRVLGRLADICFIISVGGFLLIFLMSASHADFSAVLPVGANGANNVLKGAFCSVNRFGDCAYLVFFIGEFKREKKGGFKILLSYAATAIAIIAFTVVFYGIFSYIAFRQKFALTEISRYSTVINHIGRFDYIGIMMILFSSVFSLSVPVFLSGFILQKIFPLKQKWIYPAATNLILFLFLVVFRQYFASIENFITLYGGYAFILFDNLLPVFFSLLACINKENKKEKVYEISAD